MDTQEKRKAERAKANARARAEKDVVYTQAKPFNRNRFLLRLVTVIAIVLAILFGMSIFFNVHDVEISGTVKYDPWTVREASGIVEGENLITLSKANIASNIMALLPYVDTVRVGIRLPDTVVIQITELDVVYSIQDQEGSWWLISADGKVVDTCKTAAAEDYTRILGVQLSAPSIGSPAIAYEPITEPEGDEQTVPVTVYASDRLQTAVQIAKHMESTGLIGTVSKVDVSDMGDIELWYENRFQMLLGNSSELYKKIDALAQSVSKLDAYDSGILDASFTYWPDQVGYSQFP